MGSSHGRPDLAGAGISRPAFVGSRPVVPLLAGGRLAVPVAATFPLTEVAAAYDRFAAGGKIGKIVVVMGDATAPRR